MAVPGNLAVVGQCGRLGLMLRAQRGQSQLPTHASPLLPLFASGPRWTPEAPGRSRLQTVRRERLRPGLGAWRRGLWGTASTAELEGAPPGPGAGPRGGGARAALSRQQKTELMKGVSSQHSLAVARVLDQVASAVRSFGMCHSDFLTPPCQEEVLRILRKIPGVHASLSGGYEEAERCRVSFGPTEAVEAACWDLQGAAAASPAHEHEHTALSADSRVGMPGAVAVCRVQGNFGAGAGARVSHGDFLGAVLGTGIAREKVGDILLLEEAEAGSPEPGSSAKSGRSTTLMGAHVIVVPELEAYILSSLTSVHQVEVQVTSVPLSDIQVRPQRVSQLRSVEASLRLDAVGSAGFRISRSKFSDLVSAGKVRLNWREDVKPGSQVSTGDVISVRGMGRCKVGDIETTKKGRFAVEITRYA